ncbi:MAG: alpha-hydroxy-acid oxidizing protein [Verrucomicrobia bacterium]|nr:MAG: alpha-hydroxy-acid oxidizing protein [Verrucomicrobiota bacterium]
MSRSVQPPRVINIEDLRRIAKRRLPRVVFDYIDGGAEAERTLRANSQAYEAVTLRPRCAIATPACDLRTAVLGTSLSMPLILAPVGSCRLMYPRGEEAAARAAGRAGIIYTLSTLSGCRLEDVAAASEGPVWYQLYLVGGRDCALAAIERARKAGFSALVVTIDTAVAGMRERDIRNGAKELLSGNLREILPFVRQLFTKPRWLAAFLADGGLMKFANVIIPGKGPMLYADVTTALEQAVVSWQDLSWIRDAWNGPIIIKGVHTGEDARRAVDVGANALVVSNHGGRQLDGVAPTLQMLPEVLSAVGDRVEVLLDGGIRRGSDIVKALCLGARAVLTGRAYAYGLGAAGEVGVTRAIEILRTDLIRTLKLLGCASIAHLDRSFIDFPAEWLRKQLCDSPQIRKSPHPDTKNCGNDKRDPAQAHWNGMGANRDLGMVDQSEEVTQEKNSEDDACDA